MYLGRYMYVIHVFGVLHFLKGGGGGGGGGEERHMLWIGSFFWLGFLWFSRLGRISYVNTYLGLACGLVNAVHISMCMIGLSPVLC